MTSPKGCVDTLAVVLQFIDLKSSPLKGDCSKIQFGGLLAFVKEAIIHEELEVVDTPR